jgi:hypothetical protein
MDDQKLMEMLALLLQGQTEMRSELGEVRKDLTKLSVKVEGEMVEKIRGLYDAREVQNYTNERILSALESIEAKLHVVQVDTFRVLKNRNYNK